MNRLRINFDISDLIDTGNGYTINLSKYHIDSVLNVYLSDKVGICKEIRFHYEVKSGILSILDPLKLKIIDSTHRWGIRLEVYSIVEDRNIKLSELLD